MSNEIIAAPENAVIAQPNLLSMALSNGEEEIWLPVVGYEGLYSISNLGRIRSEDRMVRSKSGEYFKKGIILSPCGGSYLSVRMCDGSTKKTTCIHRMVAAAFIGKVPEGEEVMHLDGVTHNNNINNLRYGSRSCNFAFKVDDGTDNCGEKGTMSKLTTKEVVHMRWIWRITGDSYAKIAKKFSVAPMTAFRAINKQCWGCI